jgi:hypothetical protein
MILQSCTYCIVRVRFRGFGEGVTVDGMWCDITIMYVLTGVSGAGSLLMGGGWTVLMGHGASVP